MLKLDLKKMDSARRGEPSPTEAQEQPAPDGPKQAFRVPLADIIPDPNQPRDEKDPQEISELADEIRAAGVKMPISIRPHPGLPGKWLINDGEMRYLGSLEAGQVDVPAVVDEKFDDFDQVNVNEKRYALKPLQLARFVKRKLDQGMKKNEVAKRLRKPNNAVTELLALIDMPAHIDAIYSSGRCRSPKTLYDLRALNDKFPAEVQAWCEQAEEVTRTNVNQLSDQLKGKRRIRRDENSAGASTDSASNPGSGDNSSSDFVATKTDPQSKGPKSGDGEAGGKGTDGAGKQTRDPDAERDNGELTSWPRGKAVSDPNLMSKPLLMVTYQGRSAAVLLNRRPSDFGRLHLRFDDGAADIEVDAAGVAIISLTEQTK